MPFLSLEASSSPSDVEEHDLEGQDLSLLPVYPDPDSATHVTNYPWLGEGAQNFDSSFGLEGPLSNSKESDLDFSSSDEEGMGIDALNTLQDGSAIDPDYMESEDLRSDDDIMSDEENNSTLGFQSGLEASHALQIEPTLNRAARPKRRKSAHASGALRGHAQVGFSKGAKGIKRGLRRPVEPGIEVTTQLSKATIAFTNGDFEAAEDSALIAVRLNPEVFQAHNLLSQIHAARGDSVKSIDAAYNGAHTRPRDTEMWKRVATMILGQSTAGREECLKDALYCYARIITVDRYNVEARYQRAAINRELGHRRKAVAEYEYLLKHLPQDMTLLRHLADICIELDIGERALKHYESTMEAIVGRSSENNTAAFTWSDVNIMAELYIRVKRFEAGLTQTKRLCRYLLGRSEEMFWDEVSSDDREWDLEDFPRRIETTRFRPGPSGRCCYGEGLPLEIRAKMGVFRLSMSNDDFIEAEAHFKWLQPEDQGEGAKVHDFPDLFREVASALRRKQKFNEALRFLTPLRHIGGLADSHLLMEMAACYKAIKAIDQAEECYKTLLSLEPDFTEARVALWILKNGLDDLHNHDDLSASTQKVPKLRGVAGSRKSSNLFNTRHRPFLKDPVQSHDQSPLQRHKLPMTAEQEGEILILYSRWKELRRDETAKASLLEASGLLLQSFRDNRVFYPGERSHRFYGYSREARWLAHRRKSERAQIIQKSKDTFVTPDGDEIIVPDHYLGISFAEWLDIFLETAVDLTKLDEIKSAYELITDATHANVFYHSPDALLAIHVCWFACALFVNDEESICNIARWFMMQYQFVTDSYRLFSALNRLCDSRNEWFNSGPTQKYILRQLKAVDFSLWRGKRKSGLFQERASYTTKDAEGRPIQAKDLDVALLMLYGHILYAGKSFAYAVNYFLRALSVDTSNTAIQLSLALAYVHWALKRQAENRHHLIMQGLAFLMQYYDSCQKVGGKFCMQEAEYNVGRTYHLLGLVNLAIPYYERCLKIGLQIDEEDDSGGCAENFSHEAALALQTHWAMNGDFARAQAVTQAWLVM